MPEAKLFWLVTRAVEAFCFCWILWKISIKYYRRLNKREGSLNTFPKFSKIKFSISINCGGHLNTSTAGIEATFWKHYTKKKPKVRKFPRLFMFFFYKQISPQDIVYGFRFSVSDKYSFRILNMVMFRWVLYFSEKLIIQGKLF